MVREVDKAVEEGLEEVCLDEREVVSTHMLQHANKRNVSSRN
jgi:hypothetical protein